MKSSRSSIINAPAINPKNITGFDEIIVGILQSGRTTLLREQAGQLTRYLSAELQTPSKE